ncbi:MAG: hypothetical protein P8M80_07415, partial [Pirellulaceae bacterium]|nr:hypothetical protein [Pirellulaceae bacterium]
MIHLLLIVAQAGLANANLQSDQDNKYPVPKSAELRVAVKTIKELYKDSLATRDEYMLNKIAETLFKDAIGTKNDIAVKYQLMLYARDIYVDLVNVIEFNTVCKQLNKDFDVALNEL